MSDEIISGPLWFCSVTHPLAIQPMTSVPEPVEVSSGRPREYPPPDPDVVDLFCKECRSLVAYRVSINYPGFNTIRQSFPIVDYYFRNVRGIK